MTASSRYSRHCLNVHMWPQADQEAWIRATTPGSVLDEDLGLGANWRPPTRIKVRKGYGRWINFLMNSGALDVSIPPTERITPAAVKQYVLLLKGQVTSWTVWGYIASLWSAARAFAPNQDWKWLYKITAKLGIQCKATKNKLKRMRPPHEIAEWAFNQLDSLQQASDRRPATVLKYRNALFVAVLINCPLRLRNLVMISMGKHLRWVGDFYSIDFTPDEVKTNRYLSVPLPVILTPYINAWINEWRPILLKDQTLDVLWIGIRGDPMHERGVYQGICEATKTAFGISINPHLFRDIAVTSIADMTPENISITAPLLGHINPKTTEKHYIHASQVTAGRHYRSSVSSLRKLLAKEFN